MSTACSSGRRRSGLPRWKSWCTIPASANVLAKRPARMRWRTTLCGNRTTVSTGTKNHHGDCNVTTKTRIYIAGAGGMLGEAFHEVFGADYELRCTDKEVNDCWLSLLDFRNFDAYRRDVAEFKPDLLFHLCAHTSLEYCEQNPDDAYLTNTLAVENAVHIANSLDIPILYISTAGIFDGEQERYDDWDIPRPLGHYARSKYMGERFVVENCRRYLVCRAGWMMGAGPKKDKKFIQKLAAQIKNGKRELFIVNDKLGTPTYTLDFARNA